MDTRVGRLSCLLMAQIGAAAAECRPRVVVADHADAGGQDVRLRSLTKAVDRSAILGAEEYLISKEGESELG